jgi:hypothetical protein
MRGFMSLGSSADIIPFTRFLECRQRRHRIASANATVVMAASTDAGVRPDVTGTSKDDDGASPRAALATVQAPLPHSVTRN